MRQWPDRRLIGKCREKFTTYLNVEADPSVCGMCTMYYNIIPAFKNIAE